MRLAAAAVLPEVAEGGDGRAIAALTASCEDGDTEVVLAAVAGLSAVGDDGAIAALCGALQHRDDVVRLAAVDAMLLVAKPGDEQALAALELCAARRGLVDENVVARAERAKGRLRGGD